MAFELTTRQDIDNFIDVFDGQISGWDYLLVLCARKEAALKTHLPKLRSPCREHRC